ncbi:MAG: RpiB/LacA/LacB family sugar-phosphate isomerase [Patescibacteria group bacterium]
MPKPTIYLGADHAGFELKERLKSSLPDAIDLGANTLVADDDYPSIARAVAEAVVSDPGSVGILSCGNAVGVCVVANKTKGIRAGIGFSIEAARSMRNDDDVNVLCVPGRIAIMDDAVEIAKAFLATPFSNEERHVRRLAQYD